MLDARSTADKQAIARHADAAQWDDLEYEVGRHSHPPGPAVLRATQPPLAVHCALLNVMPCSASGVKHF